MNQTPKNKDGCGFLGCGCGCMAPLAFAMLLLFCVSGTLGAGDRSWSTALSLVGIAAIPGIIGCCLFFIGLQKSNISCDVFPARNCPDCGLLTVAPSTDIGAKVNCQGCKSSFVLRPLLSWQSVLVLTLVLLFTLSVTSIVNTSIRHAAEVELRRTKLSKAEIEEIKRFANSIDEDNLLKELSCSVGDYHVSFSHRYDELDKKIDRRCRAYVELLRDEMNSDLTIQERYKIEVTRTEHAGGSRFSGSSWKFYSQGITFMINRIPSERSNKEREEITAAAQNRIKARGKEARRIADFESSDFSKKLSDFPLWYHGLDIGELRDALNERPSEDRFVYRDDGDDEFRTDAQIARRKIEQENQELKRYKKSVKEFYSEFSYHGRSLESTFITTFDWDPQFNPEKGFISSGRKWGTGLKPSHPLEPMKYPCDAVEAKRIIRGGGISMAIVFKLKEPFTGLPCDVIQRILYESSTGRVLLQE